MKFTLNLLSFPHSNFFSSLPNKIKWEWPLVKQVLLKVLLFNLGYSILFSGAIPIKVKFFLKQNLSIPFWIPLSIIIAFELNAALEIPDNNFPLFLVFAPIKFIIGVGSYILNYSNISFIFKFLLFGSFININFAFLPFEIIKSWDVNISLLSKSSGSWFIIILCFLISSIDKLSVSFAFIK